MAEAAESKTDQDTGQTPQKTADDPNTQKKRKKQSSPMNPIQIFFLNAIIIVTALWLMFGFVFGFATMPNGDMAPNLKSGDLLLYYRLYHGYKAQDVVVLRKNDTVYVGRIVAVGGDTAEITDSESLVINGNTMIESNIYYPTPRYEGFTQYPLTLADGEYFVLSDMRSGGEDSRYYGAVSEHEILGKVITSVRRNNL